MAITRIKRIQECGVFRDFEWPNGLPNLARYNLIYGWNGSGKTTLSRLLRAMELRTPLQEGIATVATDDGDISSANFASANMPIRVFNRDFMVENVFPTSGANVPLILVVGKESVEKQKEVEKLTEDLKAANASRTAARSRWQEDKRSLDSLCIDKARAIKDALRSSGSNRYNNYDKSDFAARVQKMISDCDTDSHILDESERNKALLQHRATRKDRIVEVAYRLPNLDSFVSTVSDLLQITVVSQAIQTLKGDPVLAEWTRQGLGLHRDRNVDRCLFCAQPLPNGRLSAIEAHFSAEYDRFLLRLREQTVAIQAASRQISELEVPNKAEFYEDLAEGYESHESELWQTLDTVKQFLNALVTALENKNSHPFEALKLNVRAPEANVKKEEEQNEISEMRNLGDEIEEEQSKARVRRAYDVEVVERLNGVIRKHNTTCDEFENRCNNARERLALDMIATSAAEYKQRSQAVTQSSASATSAEKRIRALEAEIGRLETEVVEHRRPAEELNEDLLKYLGHGDLKLQVMDNGYAIVRSGVPAGSLSEGEMTAIALLYFLKSLQDRRFDLATSLIVLDDPVSSLDANALFLAFGLIQERTKDAQQLIILTHNFAFFRQVRNWFHHLKSQKKRDIALRPARLYMVECSCESVGRQAAIRPLDPLLEQYDSEYHYLFDRIYRTANDSRISSLAENYTLVNMARRLLEAFLAFRQPHVAGEMWQKLQAISFDEAKKIRILRFLHTFSHNSAIGDPEHDPSVLSEANAILSDLLELIKSEDCKHFSAMERVVTSISEEAIGG